MSAIDGHGKIVGAAVWLESEGMWLLGVVSPYLFGIATLLGGVFLPQIYAETAGLSGGDTAWVWFTSWLSWVFLGSGLIAVFGNIASFRAGRRIEKELREAKSSVRSVRDELGDKANELVRMESSWRDRVNDAEQHGEFLRQELDAALQELSASYLRQLVKEFRFGDTERISLYAHDGENSFILAGRHSLHPMNGKANRLKLPESEGFVAKAWANGGRYFAVLPDWADLQQYSQEVQQHCEISQEALQNLRMKSQTYYAIAIIKDETRSGVVVLESSKRDAFATDDVDEYIKPDNAYLAQLIARSKVANPFLTMRQGQK